MQLSTLFKRVSEDPQWMMNNIKPVALSSLTIDDDGSQVRAGGIVASHVQDLVDDILIRGQQVPITIDQNDEVVEGNHRVKAFQALARKNPGVAKWQMINAWKRTFTDDAERRQYQLRCNNHPPAKSSSNADLALSVADDLKAGVFPGLVWNTFHDNADNFDLLAKEVKSRYQVDMNKAKAISKVAVLKAPNQKLKNYSKDEVLETFKANNCIGWSGKKPGEDSNGYSVYPIGAESNIFPNLTGNTFKKKTSNGKKISTVCVLWDGNTYGKDGKKIDSYRQTVVNKINEANASWVLSKDATLVDEVFIVGQKIRGTKENVDKFFKVKKDSSGRFEAGSIPRNGWK